MRKQERGCVADHKREGRVERIGPYLFGDLKMSTMPALAAGYAHPVRGSQWGVGVQLLCSIIGCSCTLLSKILDVPMHLSHV